MCVYGFPWGGPTVSRHLCSERTRRSPAPPGGARAGRGGGGPHALPAEGRGRGGGGRRAPSGSVTRQCKRRPWPPAEVRSGTGTLCSSLSLSAPGGSFAPPGAPGREAARLPSASGRAPAVSETSDGSGSPAAGRPPGSWARVRHGGGGAGQAAGAARPRGEGAPPRPRGAAGSVTAFPGLAVVGLCGKPVLCSLSSG